MKKFLLSIAGALLAVPALLAETVTINVNTGEYTSIDGTHVAEKITDKSSEAEHWQPLNSVVYGQFTISGDKATGSTAPAYYGTLSTKEAKENTIRAYTGNTITISGAEGITITAVAFKGSNGKKVNELTASTGTLSGNTTASSSAFNWSGKANSFTLTFAGAYRINSLEITYNTTGEGGEGGGDTPTPPTVETTGQGTAASPYTVEDVIKLNNPGTESWVKGYIVGCFNYDQAQSKNVFSATELNTATNIAIAPAATGYDESQIIAVQLKSGSEPYTALNLKDTPANLGKEVSVFGGLIGYITGQGVKPCTAYAFDGETPVDPEPVETTGKGTETEPYTVADVIKLNNPGSTAWVKGFIVGDLKTSDGYKCETAAPFSSDTNLYIAATANETDSLNMVLVQLPAGAIRTALNLKDTPANLGKELLIKGSLETYSRQHGVKNPTDYKLDGQGSGTEQPGVPAEGPGSQSEPYSVAEAIALNNNGSKGWVSGVIVGVMNYVDGQGNTFSATELTTNTNLVIAATAENYGTALIAVQLPAGKIREDLNLVDRPGNLGKEVSVCGSFIKYCGINGVKETTDYTIVGGIAPLPIGEIGSLTEFIEEQPTTFARITSPVTVFYQSPDKKYTFITDGDSNIEVYGEMANAYSNGDQLTGIIGKFSYYKQMPQMTPDTESFGAATAGTPVEPKATTLDKVQIADYVTVSNVSIVADEDGKFNVTDGTTTLQLFDRFAIGNIEAAESVTITGIGAIYEETKQLFPISITESSAISEINAANGAAVIFDLQGRRLAAPVKGINIINGRKVLVK